MPFGDEMDIILELHAKTDFNAALQIAKLAEEFNIYYLRRTMRAIKSTVDVITKRKKQIFLWLLVRESTQDMDIFRFYKADLWM